MFKVKEISTLYWANIQGFWNNSFKSPDRPTSIFPFVFWIVELIFFIPNIIIIPFVLTIVQLVTRKPIAEKERAQLSNALEDLHIHHSDKFDRFIAELYADGNHDLYQSTSSRNVIYQLGTINKDKKKAEIVELENEHGHLESFLNGSPARQAILKFWLECSTRKGMLSPDSTILIENREHKAFDLKQTEWEYFFTKHSDAKGEYYTVKTYSLPSEKKVAFRDRELKAIQSFILNPKNNGKKLMQYLQVNLSEDMIHNTKATLECKIKIEIDRLEKIATPSSNVKAQQLKDAMLINRENVRCILLTNRCGFFSTPMPASYNNVFCTIKGVRLH